MPDALLFSVRFHDGRYHGTGNWPPSPARLFQALVAGVAKGGGIPQKEHCALTWLESLDPPAIATPKTCEGQSYLNYVPNNDLDAKGGDPEKIAGIRTSKQIRPRLFNAETPLLYCWRFGNDPNEYAHTLVEIAERLYQLGRGVDMAWAQAEVLKIEKAEKRLEEHGGTIHRPTDGNSGTLQACPGVGSLKSLIERHKAMGERFSRGVHEVKGKKQPCTTFTQPPKPRFRQVAYDSPPTRLLYDLRHPAKTSKFQAWPLTSIVRLTETVRDRAADQLAAFLPNEVACIERVFGRAHDLTEADKARRIRITPLPSTGHPNAESSIRRVLIEIPPDCPLPVRNLAWAFSGLHLGSDPETGEIRDDSLPALVEADDWRMPDHYGLGQNRKQAFHLWHTITPVALPNWRGRGRQNGPERADSEKDAMSAVIKALRHAHIPARAETIRVQREPFGAKGARAESFAPGTRFAPPKLWHVEIAFSAPLHGSLILGDGRYLGLGLMAPQKQTFREAVVFAIGDDAPPAAARTDILTALRRALMALDRDENGTLSSLFSGHAADGAPAGNGAHQHVFLAADTTPDGSRLARLYVIRPDLADRKSRLPGDEKARFERVTGKLQTVRAGPHGVLRLKGPAAPGPDDQLFACSRIWTSLTDYRPTRHTGRGKNPQDAVIADVLMECARRGLPRPHVTLLELDGGPKGGNLRARLRLYFDVAVPGPLMLGRNSHKGGGLFSAAQGPADGGQ